MIEINASDFWGGVILIVGVQVFSMVFERLMLYKMLADLKRDSNESKVLLQRLASAMQHMSLSQTRTRYNQGSDTELGDIFSDADK